MSFMWEPMQAYTTFVLFASFLFLHKRPSGDIYSGRPAQYALHRSTPVRALTERGTISFFAGTLGFHPAREPLLDFGDPVPRSFGRRGLPFPLRCGERTFQANLGFMQRNGVAPTDFHIGRLSLRFGKLVASMGDRPLGHGDHLVEPQLGELGAQLPPVKGDVLGKKLEQSVAQAGERRRGQCELGHRLAMRLQQPGMIEEGLDQQGLSRGQRERSAGKLVAPDGSGHERGGARQA